MTRDTSKRPEGLSAEELDAEFDALARRFRAVIDRDLQQEAAPGSPTVSRPVERIPG